jgi:beta-lactam-binding protein with PASTA domain
VFRAQTNFTARYSAESEVIFSVTEGRTISATGTIKLEVSGKVPMPPAPAQETTPEQKQQSQPEGSNSERESEQGQGEQGQGEQGQSQPQEQTPTTPSPTVAPAFQLKVDAKFDLVQMQ